MKPKYLILPSLFVLLVSCAPQPPEPTPDEEIVQLLELPEAYASVSEELFDRLGWSLPDEGRHVRALADAAPGGAFDPAALEQP